MAVAVCLFMHNARLFQGSLGFSQGNLDQGVGTLSLTGK